MRGQTFQFRHCAAVPDVVWAEGPDAVPAWDWSRWNVQGGGLSAYGSFSARGVPWPDAAVQAISARALPTPTMDYPRLVRAHPGRQATPEAAETFKVFLSLWPALRDDPSGQSEAFRQGVLKAVPRIGLLDPHGTGDTLNAWRSAVLAVYFWTNLLRELNILEADEVNEGFWDVRHREWGIQFKSAAEVNDEGTQAWLAVGWEAIEEMTTGGLNAGEVVRLIALARKAMRWERRMPAPEVRAAIAQALTRDFAQLAPRRLERFVVEDDPLSPANTMLVSVGSLDWALYELAELFGKTEATFCLECGVPFIPNRKDQQYCSGLCQDRLKKRRRRARTRRPDAEEPTETGSVRGKRQRQFQRPS